MSWIWGNGTSRKPGSKNGEWMIVIAIIIAALIFIGHWLFHFW